MGTEFPGTVGGRIRALREARGMSQGDLAQVLGTKQPTVSRMETGDCRGLTLSTLAEVAWALGARVEVEFRERV